MVWTACAMLVLNGALEEWRPFFYLTDDNLTATLPVMVEWSRHLWAGQWPFVNHSLMGGELDLLRDPGALNLLSPWLLLASYHGASGNPLVMVDLVGILNSITTAVAFCWAACWFKANRSIDVPGPVILFCSVSYALTPFTLLVTSSWIGFLNVQASFCVMMVALVHPSRRQAVLLNALGMAWALFGGHPHTFLMGCAFTGVAAVVVALGSRSGEPLLRLVGGAVVFVVLGSPFLLPTFGGFAGSPRATGMTPEQVGRGLALSDIASSWLLGPLAIGVLPDGVDMHGADRHFNLSVAFTAANPIILFALARALKRRPGSSALEWALLVLVATALLTVQRSEPVAWLMARLPLLRSLQWPFRELWIPVAALHLWFILAYRPIATRWWGLLAGSGVAGVLAFRLLFEAPTFYPFPFDRYLLLSGVAERYWDQVLAGQPTRPHHVLSVAPELLFNSRPRVPWPLLGGYNYPSLFGPISESGYTFTTSPTRDRDLPRPYYFAGAYSPEDARKVVALVPGCWLTELVGVAPVTWTLDDGKTTRVFRFVEASGQVEFLGTATPIAPSGEP